MKLRLQSSIPRSVCSPANFTIVLIEFIKHSEMQYYVY